MATGADEKFWQDARLRSVMKHGIVKRYLPVFLARTSARLGKAVYVDGYAGRGRYENGQLGSSGLAMEFALTQKYGQNREYTLLLYELDPESFQSLDELAEQYRGRGLDVRAERKDVASVLDDVIASTANKPMFVFLDPCGVGISFEAMIRLLNRAAPRHRPPTEVLLNFNHDAVRRIGGHLRSENRNEATIQRLDAAVGGAWWHEAFEQTDQDPVEFVVEGFKQRLADATGMFVESVEVSDGPRKRPIYDLVFGTRHPRGVWNFADAAAQSTKEWWEQSEAAESQLGLFPTQPDIEDVEREAIPVIKSNIKELLASHGQYILGDHPPEVFGAYLGRVRAKVARTAVKQLHADGATATDGVSHGQKLEDMLIRPAP